MFRYIAFRLAVTVPVLLIVSVLVFIIIPLPPCDYFGCCVVGECNPPPQDEAGQVVR